MSLRRTRAWVEVRADRVRGNLRAIADALGPEAALLPMVKADAYGLGMDRAVRALAPERPRGWGVASVEEGRRLRELGVEEPVLVFSPVPPDSYGDAVAAELTTCLSDLDALGRLEAAVRRAPAAGPAPFQIEVDTGMGRAGFVPGDVEVWGPLVRQRASAGSVRWTGIFTHLHSADTDPGSVARQWASFREVVDRLDLPREPDFLVHVANSAGALCCGGLLPPVARPGIFLYGGRAGEGLPAPEPVLSLRARVVRVAEVAAGTPLGYGSTWRARSPERWATLGIGYGDGYPRALSGRGSVLLRGRRYPVIGRISMDVTVVNISGAPGVEVGDVATLIGRDGAEEITVDEVADEVGTISYEILTGLTPRLPRIWLEGSTAGAGTPPRGSRVR